MSNGHAIEDQVLRATQRLARLRARELLKEKRHSMRNQNAMRKAALRRRIELGAMVESANLSDWDPAAVLGLLLDGRERHAHSPTLRLAMKHRGEAHRRGPEPARPRPPKPPASRGGGSAQRGMAERPVPEKLEALDALKDL